MADEPANEPANEPAGEPAGEPANEPAPDPDTGDDADKWKALARKHENEAKKIRQELADLKTQSQTEAEKALEKAKKEGREEAAAEALASMVDTTIEAVAADKLADLAYVRLLDDDRSDFVTDGKPDRKAITKAIDDLVKKRPALAKAGSRGAPLPGGGKETGSGGFDLNDEIRRRAGR